MKVETVGESGLKFTIHKIANRLGIIPYWNYPIRRLPLRPYVRVISEEERGGPCPIKVLQNASKKVAGESK